MLKMEPDSRISAEDALNDPYLSRYHDPDDEPICVPVFDFSFEKQVRHCVILQRYFSVESKVLLLLLLLCTFLTRRVSVV